MGSLEELLLNELQETGVFDLAASVGIVQHGRLQAGGRPAEEVWPPQAQPPLGAAVPQQVPQQVPDHGMDAEELHAANESVAACLRAAESATVALRLTDLQLAQWSAGGPGGAVSPDGAQLGSPSEANGGAAAAAAAAAAAGSDPAEAGSAETPTGAAPLPAAAGIPKRKRATRGGAAAAAAAASSAAGDASLVAGLSSAVGGGSVAAAAAGRKEPLGKASALRHFSLKVCEKVESKVDTSYEEVANELIADIAAEVAAGTAEAATDEKNIRRRCYDALNVLEAIGMITKTKKSIRWKGWPTGLGRSAEERLRAERARAMERLDQKRQLLEDAIQKCYCLSNLVSRNHAVPLPVLLRMQESGQRVPNPLKLPFILVRTDQGADLQVDISPNNLHADIDFGSWPFAILDDDQVMKLLDLQQPSPLLDSVLQQQQRQVESQLAAQRAQREAAAQQAQQAERQRQAAAAVTLQQVQQAQPPPPQQPELVAGVPPSLRPQPQLALAPAAGGQQPPVPRLLPAGAHVAPAAAGPQAPQFSTLQLYQALGSPAAAAAGLGSIVSAMELGSPPAGAARAAAAGGGSSAGAFFSAAQQQQQQREQQQQQQREQQQAGASMLAPAGGIKPEPGTAPAATVGVPPQLHMAAGWPVAGSGPGGAMPLGQQPLPQLRPAAAATLQQFQQQQQQQVQQQHVQQAQLWQQQQQQQQQQPVLRPALQPAPAPQ